MERPSHMHFTHESFSHRLPLIGLAALLPVGMFWLFGHGLGGQVIKIFQPDPLVADWKEPVKTRTPPPPDPKFKAVETVTAIPPIFNSPRDTNDNGIKTSIAPAHNDGGTVAVGATRAPASIMATHTVPPYSTLARRMGWEGIVVLRLTVLADGRVGTAEVVTSSGRAELDQTAQSWIVRHWTYRPALDNGMPAVGQTLARVTFSLKD